jgi:hypothetical protein
VSITPVWPRHCEERPRRSNPGLLCLERWIASRSLSSGAHSRDPLARNDEGIAKLYKGHHTPRMRGIQYAAAFRFHHCCLWNTGSSAGACHRAAIRPTRWRTMTTEYDSAFSLLKKPELCMNFSLQKTEGAGNAGCALHPRSRVQNAQKEAHTSIQVQSEQSGIPCAMALRLMPCSPRRANSSCHRRCRLDG